MAHDILILMGATGTGKSAFALELAQRVPAVIINADAMQLYADLQILTARPTAAEMAQAEHALYGVLAADEASSVARWLALVKPAIEQSWAQGKLPLLVGGTGMYVKALIEGLAEVPPIPDEIRERIRALPQAERLAQLQEKDPAMAARLKPGDSQRIARALEVIEATGTSLAEWQAAPAAPVFSEATYHRFYLDLPREVLYPRLDARFSAMMEAGALAEIEALRRKAEPSGLPIWRATGVPELLAHLNGEMALDEAVTKARQSTRNYAKRQMTWLRNQWKDAVRLEAGKAPAAEILAFLGKQKN